MKCFNVLALAFAGLANAAAEEDPSAGTVIELMDSTFDDEVMADEKSIWFIKFYAPWCGHCKTMEPAWESVASQLKGRVKIGRVDATENTVLAKRFGIESFPTLKLLPSGPKSDEGVESYEEHARDESSLMNFALTYYSKTVTADELLHNQQLYDLCDSSVCVLAFLPHLFDCQADCRNEYLKKYNSAIQSRGNVPCRFLWLQGGDQYELEEKLNLGFGFPALVAIHLKKGKYGIHRGNFEHESVTGFLTSLMSGKVPLNDLPKELPTIKRQQPWDGKDMEMPKEEL